MSARRVEYCIYNSRSFRVDLKNILKKMALDRGLSLEEMVNVAVEAGIRLLQAQEGRKGAS